MERFQPFCSIKNNTFTWALACLVWSSLSLKGHAELYIKSLASQEYLGTELFIAALYTENPATGLETLFDHSENLRMELRVTASHISARHLSKMWVEGMAVNSGKEQFDRYSAAMLEFNNLIKGALVPGDILTIDGSPDGRTKISLNGITLDTINAQGFFSMLLRAWVGQVPLSYAFKESLLRRGSPDSALLGRYQEISPAPERILTAKSWRAIPAGKTDPAPSLEQPSTAESASKRALATDVDKAQTPNGRLANKGPKPEPEQRRASLPEPAPAPITSTRARIAPANAHKPEPAKSNIVTSTLGAEETSTTEKLTAKQEEARRRYRSKIWELILRYLEYPQRAQRRGQEGSVRLSVVIDRNGRIIELIFLEESPYHLLNQAVTRAANRADPFPAVPDELDGDEFIFDMPFTFHVK